MSQQAKKQSATYQIPGVFFALALAVITALPLNAVHGDGLVEAEPTSELLSEIKSLVDDLGADEFQVREEAETRLANMGLAAYEMLLEVRDDKDIEVRLRARHIVDSLRGRFMTTGVSDEISPWMENYHNQSKEDRIRLIEVLSKLLPESGADGLARIARFEANERLSRLAAMHILALQIDEERPRDELISMLSVGIGFSDRTAMTWLRNYVAAACRKPEALKEWYRLVQQETERDLTLEESEEFRNEYRIALRMVAIDTAHVLAQKEEAKELLSQLSNELKTDDEIIRWVGWLQSRRAWSAIVEFAQSRPQEFDASPQLRYAWAEAQLKLGKNELATETAAKALNHDGSTAEAHYRLALDLKSKRGMYDWAEAEYRKCIELSSPTEGIYCLGKVWLGELLHDLRRDEEAADLLDVELVELVVDKDTRKEKAKDGEFQLRFSTWQAVKPLDATRARAAFFRACHYRATGEVELEKEMLSQGLEADKNDVDVLIGMHSVADPTPVWIRKTEHQIQQVSASYRNQLLSAYRSYEQLQGNPVQREAVRSGLAVIHNQYAWLVGNTIGDVDEAIQNSHKSLEFSPGAGEYLDTLGRCYYRAGRLEEAAKYQRMAVERAPFELQIQRQLDLILAAIVKRDAAEKKVVSEVSSTELETEAASNDVEPIVDGGE